MRLSLNWLKEYVDIEMSPQELGQILTMAGLEVEGLEPIGESFEGIIASKILTVEPHPEADRLQICQMETGGERLQVVCSAPNLEPGSVVPLALPGSELPDGKIIGEDHIRGQRSTGMLLAEDEMGLTEDHSGIMILSPDLMPGTPLSSVPSLSDWALEVSITPNRSDCTCVLGIAREVAALTGQPLRRPHIQIHDSPPSVHELSRVTIEDSDGCPRYAAGIIQDVTLAPAPFWMRYRLHVSGVRSINNIVDVTNYVMLEMGQPLHAFDYNRLRENRIVVKRAAEGERFTSLDGENHPLSGEVLMICDGERQVALAGIMGGLNSEIFAGTRNVLLESAFFDPVTIRRGAKYLGMSTEASYRFERQIDIEGVTTALKRALSLMKELAGGRIATGIIDNYPKRYIAPEIMFSVDRANRFLGTSLTGDEMSGYLRALEMEVHGVDENRLRVIPPSFRVDIRREADLAEEVARQYGYENIPVTYPSIRPSEERESPELVLRERVKGILTGLGFTEVITYSFISPDSADILGAAEDSAIRSFVRLLNPLTIDQSVMRTSLIPGLMNAVRTNALHDEKGLRLFEWGKVFVQGKGQELPFENTHFAGIITGIFDLKTWYHDERLSDFFDAKGAVEALLGGLGLRQITFESNNKAPGYNPGLSASIFSSGIPVGQVGQISRDVMVGYDLEDREAFVFEVRVEPLLEQLATPTKFQALAKFPAVYRDISMIVKREVESAEIAEIIRETGGSLVESVHFFDLYEGEKIDPSEKALAFRVCYRSREGTLEGEAVNRLHESVIERIGLETGGRLREG